MAAKLVLIIRTDLGMGRGKIAAQAAHAAVAACLASRGQRGLSEWVREGQPTVVLRAATCDELLRIVSQARAAGLPAELVHDAGRTQLASGTLTCCAVGPAEAGQIDAVTGGLPLL